MVTETSVHINGAELWETPVWAADAGSEKKWQICVKYKHLLSNENLTINLIIFNVQFNFMQDLKNKCMLAQMCVDGIIGSIFQPKCKCKTK